MRLLNTTTYKLEVFDGSTPMYGILSHRWTHEEMTYQDYHKQRSCERSGYHKIIQACDFAKDNFQDWLWIDTVCIDKKSSAELSEAINSMFEWYQEAQECYVYLADVRPPSEHDFDVVESDFFASDWFTRGWTLQELIAPSRVIFCASNWEIVGVKSSHDGSLYREFSFHVSLNSRITRITGIPEDILRNPYLIRRRSVAQRLSWASRRRTTRIEDQAYCLLGLFNVNMPLLYGERAKSFVRLQREILLSTLDESLLAWNTQLGPPAHLSCMLAESPAAFMEANNIEGSHLQANPRFKVAGGGLLEFHPDDWTEISRIQSQTYIITLRCRSNTHLSTFCATDDCSHPDFTLVVNRRPCGHFERLHCIGGLDTSHRSPERVAPWAMYMHASPASRCGQLAEVRLPAGSELDQSLRRARDGLVSYDEL